MIETEPNPLGEAPPPAPRPPPREPLPLGTVLQYVMLPGAAAICLQFSLLDPLSKIIGSAAAMGAFWIGFGRLNSLAVRIILVCCMALSLRNFPPIYVALMGCSALAGWVGAWLSAREVEEDDYFFLPAGTLGLAMVLLISMGVGGGWAGVLDRTGRLIEPWQRLWLDYFRALREAGAAGDWVTRAFLTPNDAVLARRTGLLVAATIVALWTLALWLTGRLARRALDRMKGVRTSLIVFRMHVRYIFLLIIGLVLEIFNSLGLSPTAGWVAWPVLGVVAMAGFLEGLGILLFVAAVRRMTGQPRAGFWLGVLGTATALLFPHYVVLFGLADVWLDMRKLEKLKQQLEAGTDEPEE